MKLWKETSRSSKTTMSSRRGLAATPQSAACEGRVYLRFFSARWFIVRTIWTSQTYDVIDYYFPFNTILSTVWWCPCYVTAVYVNNWSWHVHGSHSVCLLKPGVTSTVLLHLASSQEGTRYSHHLPRPVRGCLFTYGIAGFKLTLSHFQGMWPVKIVLDLSGLHTHPILDWPGRSITCS
jgi:hypothetical protein